MSKTKVKAPLLEDVSSVDLKGRYAVLKLREGDDIPAFRRVVLCTGGFGCSPKALGTAVFGKELVNGNEYRYDRFSFERLATAEEVDEAHAFFKTHGFEAVSKKYERGMKLLLCILNGPRMFRLSRHKRKKAYHLIRYVCKDDKWDVTSDTVSLDDPDKLLLQLGRWL